MDSVAPSPLNVTVPENVHVLPQMLGVQPGSPATIEVDAERARLVVTFVQEQGPYHRTRRASAADVLAGFDGAYEPPSDWPASGNELDWGEATGKEAW